MDNIRQCKCANAYQDKEHGKGMRVHTVGNKEMNCTVCGSKIAISSGGKGK